MNLRTPAPAHLHVRMTRVNKLEFSGVAILAGLQIAATLGETLHTPLVWTSVVVSMFCMQCGELASNAGQEQSESNQV